MRFSTGETGTRSLYEEIHAAHAVHGKMGILEATISLVKFRTMQSWPFGSVNDRHYSIGGECRADRQGQAVWSAEQIRQSNASGRSLVLLEKLIHGDEVPVPALFTDGPEVVEEEVHHRIFTITVGHIHVDKNRSRDDHLVITRYSPLKGPPYRTYGFVRFQEGRGGRLDRAVSRHMTIGEGSPSPVNKIERMKRLMEGGQIDTLLYLAATGSIKRFNPR